MRLIILAGVLLLSACAGPGGVTTRSTLTAADAATALATGEHLTADITTHAANEGGDPLIVMTLRQADGRAISFTQANHTPHDVMAQSAGGPLAQIMGLFGEESPLLYHLRPDDANGAPFLCGPNGPASLGYYEAPDGGVQIVGLRQTIEFATRPDGQTEALPFSPDQVCARLRFRRG